MQFVESFNMRSFYVSAKTGDNVNTCFHKVAADLAGVTLTKPEVSPTCASCAHFCTHTCTFASAPR